jgi:metal-responsive CopG/Arc/MetJ family transcriptional regulator
MAKVMVSLPDDLLRALDAEARRRGTTRSGILREMAHETLRRRAGVRAARVAEIIGDGERHGGNVATLVKQLRPGR